MAVALWGTHPGRCDGAPETSNRIIAIVNDEVITDSDVHAYLKTLMEQDDSRSEGHASKEELQGAALKRLVEERLIIQEAKRLGLTVSPDEVAQRFLAIKQRLGTADAFEQMLRESQLTEEQLKRKLREQLLVQKAIDQEVRQKIHVSPSELTGTAISSAASNASGEEAKAYHLLIRVTPERSQAEAEALAHQLYERLLRGAQFEELARTYSEDPQAQEGGLLGWVHQGALLPELDQVLFGLQPGEVSGPIQTRLGFHLVKLVERRKVAPSNDSATREQQLYQEKFGQAMGQWLEKLKQHAYIQVLTQ